MQRVPCCRKEDNPWCVGCDILSFKSQLHTIWCCLCASPSAGVCGGLLFWTESSFAVSIASQERQAIDANMVISGQAAAAWTRQTGRGNGAADLFLAVMLPGAIDAAAATLPERTTDAMSSLELDRRAERRNGTCQFGGVAAVVSKGNSGTECTGTWEVVWGMG